MSMELQAQQQALLQALWISSHDAAIDALGAGAAVVQRGAWERGVKAYRSNGHALAARALASAYPVTAQLLGDDNLDQLARGLWLSQPPARGDMALWGQALPEFIEAVPSLYDEEPYLADVARLEWLLHRAQTERDATVDPGSFGLLAERDPAEVTLILAPGTRTLASRYPVVSIVQAHLEGEPTLEQASARLRERRPETALVWRRGLKPCVRAAVPGEAAFIEALQEKRSLADSMQASPQLDFATWLAPAVQSGLLLAARPLRFELERTT